MAKYELKDLFTAAQLAAAVQIIRSGLPSEQVHRRLVNGVVMGAMPRLNKVTDQENDPDYMAYVLEAAIKAELKGD